MALLYQLIEIHYTSCSWIAAATLISFCIDRHTLNAKDSRPSAFLATLMRQFADRKHPEVL
jgi:hypothetical protein